MATGSDTLEDSRGRVLIVEDDPTTSRFLATALERAGFGVDAAGDAITAERMLSEVDYDALLVDIGLPGPSGFDLVREMKLAHPFLPMAMMTADADLDVAVRALRSSVDDFLAKPIDPKALIEQVDRLVRRGRVARGGAERVVAVGAHPGDVAIGIGGTLLRHRFMGDEVGVVILSHRGHDATDKGGAAEAQRAAEAIDARLFLHDLEAGAIPEGEPTVPHIEEALAEIIPTIVYAPSWNDTDEDHRRVHRASLTAARRVPTLYCYESLSATVDFRPDRFISIYPFIDAKVDLVGLFASRADSHPPLDAELVRSTSRYWGRFGHSRFCEPVEAMREGARDGAHVPVERARGRV